MGRTPPGAVGLFSAIDRKTAYEAFKSSGSFDPDALYARKEAMLGPYRRLKRIAGLAIVVGLAIVGLGLPLLGAAVVGGAWLLWRYQGRQVRNVEAGYGQYIGAGTDEGRN